MALEASSRTRRWQNYRGIKCVNLREPHTTSLPKRNYTQIRAICFLAMEMAWDLSGYDKPGTDECEIKGYEPSGSVFTKTLIPGREQDHKAKLKWKATRPIHWQHHSCNWHCKAGPRTSAHWLQQVLCLQAIFVLLSFTIMAKIPKEEFNLVKPHQSVHTALVHWCENQVLTGLKPHGSQGRSGFPTPGSPPPTTML